MRISKKIVWSERWNINLFENGNFPYKDNPFKTKEEESEEELEEESEENKLEKIKDDYEKFIKYIQNESKGINYDLFKDYFDNVVPSALAKQLYERKNERKNNKLVNLIRSRLSDLKDKIKRMSKDEIENEKPDKILDIVEEILEFF